MLGSKLRARAGVFAPLMRRLEAEQERWFLWMPVLLGLGIGLYFALPAEPHVLTRSHHSPSYSRCFQRRPGAWA